MDLKINGVNTTTSTVNTTSATNTNTANETGLFETEEEKAIKAEQETAMKEAQIAEYEAQLSKLNAEKSAYEADKKELESQKKVLTERKEKIENEIEANERQAESYKNQIQEFNQELAQTNQQKAQLQKQYDQSNQNAESLNKQLNEKIAEMTGESKTNVKTQKEKFEKAQKEAEEKVASGEIQESEVNDYITKKVGASQTDTSSILMNEINTINGQIKSAIESSSALLIEIGLKETKCNKLTAQITSGDKAINKLNDINSTKNTELSNVKQEISVVNQEINSVEANINSINAKIAAVQANINAVKSTSNEETKANTTTRAINVGGNENKVSSYVPKHNTANKTQTSMTYQNPFVSVSYETVDYTNFVEALDAISRCNDLSITESRRVVEQNKQEMKNIFNEIKK